jgi:subtilisin family serine protease
MKKKMRVALFAAFSVAVAVLSISFPRVTIVKSDDQATRENTESANQTPDFIKGRVLVQFRAQTLSISRRDLIAEAGAREIETLPGTGVHVIELSEGADEQAMVTALLSRSEVEFAELDRLIPPADVIPNDPWYTNWQWHLRKIQGPAAWSTSAGTSNIVIAILDTGVDGTHEDLVSKLVPGRNVYDNNSDTTDVHGHGTLVAGTASASSNNGVGVASVAWGCRIMPIRISDTTGFASYSNMANGLIWAADHGARVANLSYRASTSSTVSSAAQYFQSKGGVVTIAAGNEGTFDSSGDNPYVLTVSGTDSNDSLYSWSNTGNNIDVAAPGSAYTTVRGGGYSAASGTSFAAPIVAGIAALVLSEKPSLTADEVQALLKQSSDDCGQAGWDTAYGWGRVNAARAVTMASGGAGDSTPPTVSFVTPGSGATVSGTISVQVSASDDLGVQSVSLSLDGAAIGTDDSAPYSFNLNTIGATNGTHTLTSTARDAAGNVAGASIAVTVSNSSDTIAPEISIVTPANGTRVTTSVTVKVNASDQVGVVRVELYVDGALTATSTTSPFTIKWNSKRAAAGAHTLQSKAYDAAGNRGVSETRTVYR